MSTLTLSHMRSQRCKECDIDLSNELSSTIVYRGSLLCVNCRGKIYANAKPAPISSPYRCILV